MRIQFAVTAAAFMAAVSAPALAQSDVDDGWTGVYIGGSVGKSLQPSDQGSSILFDTNRDGNFGENVNTAAGANAFSPGFCGGAATGTGPTGCRNDKDGLEYYGHVGFDKQMGSLVVGIVGEFGKNESRDSVSGFSTTPASYTFTRTMKYNGGLRLRAGYTPNGTTLFYATGGGAYAKIRNSFTTSNTANSFTGNGGRSDAWGWSAGGGVDQKLGRNFSVGLLYLYSNLKDNDYRVAVGRGTAPLTNPFLLVNANGTDLRRSDDKFTFHSIRATASFRF